MEAGNRCFDQRVPEEINRKIVDHISDINLPYSQISREYLLREGLPPDRVIITGSPMYEVLHHYLPKIEASDVLARLGLTQHDYYVISAHREENVDAPAQFAGLIEVLTHLAETGRPVIMSTHPRTRKRIEAEGITLPHKSSHASLLVSATTSSSKCTLARCYRTAVPSPRSRRSSTSRRSTSARPTSDQRAWRRAP